MNINIIRVAFVFLIRASVYRALSVLSLALPLSLLKNRYLIVFIIARPLLKYENFRVNFRISNKKEKLVTLKHLVIDANFKVYKSYFEIFCMCGQVILTCFLQR